VTAGGCLCGAVRYTLDEVPAMVAICHCRHCQRQSGSAFSVVGAIPEASYHQSGETRTYRDSADSGQPLDRHFCATCGSPIISVAGSLPGIVIVKAGTLDDPSAWVPSVEVYCDRALDWIALSDNRAHFPGSNIGA
jgi:hypothetical protein